MRTIIGMAAFLFAASAFAQNAAPPAPRVGTKPSVQAKTQAPLGCKLVGTVRGTKLWAGDCADAAALRSSAEPATAPLADRAGSAIPVDQKR
jgi:hypothetical protein